MFSESQIKNMLFIDVETVASHVNHADMAANNPALAEHWSRKAKVIVSPKAGKPELAHLSEAELYEQEAPLYTEFSKIVTISIGQVVFGDDGEPQFKVKSYYSDDEGEILEGFNKALFALFGRNPGLQIVGHNILGFDMPLILRKFVKHGLEIPPKLMLHDIKPWDSCLIDTNAIWKFGSWVGCTLDLLCTELDIPSPKQDIKGYEVSEAYWNRQELERIKEYCENDVKATANVILRMARKSICY